MIGVSCRFSALPVLQKPLAQEFLACFVPGGHISFAFLTLAATPAPTIFLLTVTAFTGVFPDGWLDSHQVWVTFVDGPGVMATAWAVPSQLHLSNCS